ncbi:MAG: RnfABCDGE type electron transport complex subunit D [Phycisphaerae bacterium]|nr:RnfABCDGE type electron transport complex subunit D [Phycisphaerae bacterium]
MKSPAVTTAQSLPDPQVLSAADQSPLLRAPEKVHHILSVTIAAACLPLLAGIVLFGWQAALVAMLSITACGLTEWLYFRVTHTPAMLGRTHAYLTGVLLALTLPPTTPWFIVIIAAVFAILVGKAIFGGVGHFLWQPALVGRFAVAVIVPALAPLLPAGTLSPDALSPEKWGVLTPQALLLGNVENTAKPENYQGWQHDYKYKNAKTGRTVNPLEGKDAYALEHPADTLAGLSRGQPRYSSLARVRTDLPNRPPAALTSMPPMWDMFIGARPGGLGETCAVIIIIAGLYLIYRNYVKWQLPFAFLASAMIVAAVAPVHFAGPNKSVEIVFFPLLSEGFEVGYTYVNYQVLSGSMLLAAFLLATEMTSCPVTTGGQIIFGIGGGAAAMLLTLYLDTPIPAYIAVLGMNTFTPTIDAIWRPRVFGQRHLAWLLKSRR